MVHALAQSELENGWDHFRTTAGIGTHLLADLIQMTPKIGAPTMLAIKGPTVATEQDYVHSMDRSIEVMHSILSDLKGNGGDVAKNFPNRDLDTGREVQPGAYRLTDATYQRLLERLTNAPAIP